MNEVVSNGAKSRRDDTLLTADFNLRTGNAASSYGLTILRSYSLPLLTPYFPDRTPSVANTNNTPRKPYCISSNEKNQVIRSIYAMRRIVTDVVSFGDKVEIMLISNK
jgi:hypothetical protein